MSNAERRVDRPDGVRRAVGGALLAVGLLGIAGGSYVHVTMGDRTLGHCAACNPWHPTWVLTPLVAGAVLVVAGGAILARR